MNGNCWQLIIPGGGFLGEGEVNAEQKQQLCHYFDGRFISNDDDDDESNNASKDYNKTITRFDQSKLRLVTIIITEGIQAYQYITRKFRNLSGRRCEVCEEFDERLAHLLALLELPCLMFTNVPYLFSLQKVQRSFTFRLE